MNGSLRSLKEKYTNVDICYYAAFAIYATFHLLERTNFSSICGLSIDLIGKVAISLMLVLLISRLLVQFFNLRSLIIFTFCALTAVFVFINTGSWICLSLLLFIAAGRDIELRPLAWILFCSTLFVLFITLLGVYTNQILNIASVRPGETRVRYSLGFNQVNALGAVMVRLCSSVAFLRWEKSPIATVILSGTLVIFLEIVANSRTSEVVLMFIAFMHILYWIGSKKETYDFGFLLKFCLLAVFVSVFLSAIFLFFFNPSSSWQMALSELLSNRLYSAWYLFKQTALSLFGQTGVVTGGRVWTGSSYAVLTIDNAWDLWLLCYGVIPTLLLIAGLIALFKYAAKHKKLNGALVMLAILVSVFGFCESTALAFDYNPYLVLLAMPLFGDYSKLGNEGSDSLQCNY